jgi:HIV Tat-specific factor 1
MNAKKRKKEAKAKGEYIPPAPRQNQNAPSAPKKTAVYVTDLPPDTTHEKLSDVFSKAGVLLIGEDGEPRIKLYYDDDGKFKGEALIMYFKEGSVDLAVTLLDDTELEMGAGFGNMRVRIADYEKSKDAEKKDTNPAPKKNYSAEEKQRLAKRMRMMQK